MLNSTKYNELKRKYKDEKVFVLPANLINAKDKFTKLTHTNKIWTKYDGLGQYIFRYEAEYNKAFQQIIPYLLICNEDQSKFFVSERIQGDSRLKGMLSMGFGGHINSIDGFSNIVFNGLVREMNEELNIIPISPFQFIGTIRDLSSKTAEHFGLVFIVKADPEHISVKETNKLKGKWMTKEEMYDNYSNFENWSKYVLDYLFTSQ